MDADKKMGRLEQLFSHVWMVRTFLKHAEEAEEDDELSEVHRALYDVMLSLGPALDANDGPAYVRQAKKKLRKLRDATRLFLEIQPEVSTHTNFQMAARSLEVCVAEIEAVIQAS